MECKSNAIAFEQPVKVNGELLQQVVAHSHEHGHYPCTMRERHTEFPTHSLVHTLAPPHEALTTH